MTHISEAESLQHIILEQLKGSEKKQKTAKIIKIIAVCVVTVLIAFVGAVVICAELGQTWAISITTWLKENYGVTLGAGALTALAVVGKYIASINVSNSNNENLLAKVIDYVTENNGKMEDSLTAMTSKLGSVTEEITIQPATLKAIMEQTETNNQMMAVIFDVFKLYCEKTSSDVNVRRLLSNFQESSMFKKAAALMSPNEETTELVETAGEIVSKAAELPSGVKAAVRVVKKG